MPTPSLHIATHIQAAGRQIALQKIPTWYACPAVQYPQRLSLEQCSSEETARYKATLVQGNTLVDVTGGLGVDCFFLSDAFTHTTYVEQQAELCTLAQHNFACLGRNITVINQTCEQYIEHMPVVDCIFIDPARRNHQGGKVALLPDCSPNLLEIGDALLQKCRTLLVKLSPMIDIESVLRAFPTTQQVHVVAVKNECKEVLVCIKGERRISVQGERNKVYFNCRTAARNHEGEARIKEKREIDIVCTNLPLKGEPFVFTRQAENAYNATYSLPLTYLYEPNAAILKAGAFKTVALRYGLQKLHTNSHLYTSDTMIKDFPGKVFSIERITKVQRKEISDIEKANLSMRNFPGTVADLRKKLKLKDGGDVYIFATTLHDNSKVLIIGTRVES